MEGAPREGGQEPPQTCPQEQGAEGGEGRGGAESLKVLGGGRKQGEARGPEAAGLWGEGRLVPGTGTAAESGDNAGPHSWGWGMR